MMKPASYTAVGLLLIGVAFALTCPLGEFPDDGKCHSCHQSQYYLSYPGAKAACHCTSDASCGSNNKMKFCSYDTSSPTAAGLCDDCQFCNDDSCAASCACASHSECPHGYFCGRHTNSGPFVCKPCSADTYVSGCHRAVAIGGTCPMTSNCAAAVECATHSDCAASKHCTASNYCHPDQKCGTTSRQIVEMDYQEIVIFVCDMAKYRSSGFTVAVRQWDWWWITPPMYYSASRPSTADCELAVDAWPNSSTSTRSPTLRCSGYYRSCSTTGYGVALFGTLDSTGEQVRAMTFSFTYDPTEGGPSICEDYYSLAVFLICVVFPFAVCAHDFTVRRKRKQRRTIHLPV